MVKRPVCYAGRRSSRVFESHHLQAFAWMMELVYIAALEAAEKPVRIRLCTSQIADIKNLTY